jgi:hypothetical protein
VTRNSSKAWLPELVAAAGPEVTEAYIDFFTANNPQSQHATSLRVGLLAVF